jgi:hypothetical protein
MRLIRGGAIQSGDALGVSEKLAQMEEKFEGMNPDDRGHHRRGGLDL